MNAKQKKIAAFCLITIMLVMIFSIITEAKNNIALDCKIDSVCGESGENKSARMLVDDDPNYETKWEASDGANHKGEPHFIILDFGSDKNIDSLRLVKASQGSEDFGRTDLNASGFRFEISSDKITWVIIDEVTDDGDNDIYEASFIHAYGRYLKLVITQPEQEITGNENQAVRFYDLKVFEAEEISEEIPDDDGEDYEEIIEPEEVPLANITAPQTSDSLNLILLIMVILISFVISRTFSNRRSRSL